MIGAAEIDRVDHEAVSLQEQELADRPKREAESDDGQYPYGGESHRIESGRSSVAAVPQGS